MPNSQAIQKNSSTPDKPDVEKSNDATERGDAILKRMLKTPPKPHKEAVAERKAKRDRVNKGKASG